MTAQESKRVAGRLAIMRLCPGDGDDTIRVEIRIGESSSRRLVAAEVSLADFALCITGRDGIPATLRLFPSKCLP